MKRLGTSYGLIADPRKIPNSRHADVTIETVTAKNVHEYASTMLPDAHIEDHAIERHRKAVHHHIEHKRDVVSHLLARYKGKAAGTAQIRYHDGYAFIPGGRPQVNEEFTSHGVFTDLVAHMAEDAVKRRLHVIATYAGNDCVPTWSKMGFAKTCDYQIYVWRPN
jgi:hypothetical protein